MSNIVLGSMARQNHGLRVKYPAKLPQQYQTFIDSLEAAMIQATYDKNNTADCMITVSCTVPDDLSGLPYLPLERAIIIKKINPSFIF